MRIRVFSIFSATSLDDRPYETDPRGYGRVFPHRFGAADDSLLYTQVLVNPRGGALVAEFAKALVVSESLGDDTVTDYLSVSFSGVDAVNHFFCPGSLETQDMVRQLDRTTAALLGMSPPASAQGAALPEVFPRIGGIP